VGIGEGKLAKNEKGAAIRRDLACVDTIGAQAGGFAKVRLFLFRGHEIKDNSGERKAVPLESV